MHGKRDGACSQAFQGLRRFLNYLTAKLLTKVRKKEVLVLQYDIISIYKKVATSLYRSWKMRM